MRDKFRRLLGLTPKPAPVEDRAALPAPAAGPSGRAAPSTPPRGKGEAVEAPAAPPARPAARPDSPPEPQPKPVHSVSERKTGRSGTEPLTPRPEFGAPDARQQAEQYLQRLQVKVHRLADDFAEGAINRDQFQKLYEHYQRERRAIESLLAADPNDEELKSAIGEGKSIAIRKQHVARAVGYAIYENHSGMPLKTLGKFELDPALVVPMLSSYRAATQEIFGAGIRSTEIEGGRWLCFVPGEITTLLALFTNEPAEKQLAYLEDLHRLFEKANRHRLTRAPIESALLLFPHEFFLK